MSDAAPNQSDAHDLTVSVLVANFKNMLSVVAGFHPMQNGDVMSAAIHLLVDTGMMAVVTGICDREKLTLDLCNAVRETVANHSGEVDEAGQVTHEATDTAQ